MARIPNFNSQISGPYKLHPIHKNNIVLDPNKRALWLVSLRDTHGCELLRSLEKKKKSCWPWVGLLIYGSRSDDWHMEARVNLCIHVSPSMKTYLTYFVSTPTVGLLIILEFISWNDNAEKHNGQEFLHIRPYFLWPFPFVKSISRRTSKICGLYGAKRYLHPRPIISLFKFDVAAIKGRWLQIWLGNNVVLCTIICRL